MCGNNEKEIQSKLRLTFMFNMLKMIITATFPIFLKFEHIMTLRRSSTGKISMRNIFNMIAFFSLSEL